MGTPRKGVGINRTRQLDCPLEPYSVNDVRGKWFGLSFARAFTMCVSWGCACQTLLSERLHSKSVDLRTSLLVFGHATLQDGKHIVLVTVMSSFFSTCRDSSELGVGQL